MSGGGVVRGGGVCPGGLGGGGGVRPALNKNYQLKHVRPASLNEILLAFLVFEIGVYGIAIIVFDKE